MDIRHAGPQDLAEITALRQLCLPPSLVAGPAIAAGQDSATFLARAGNGPLLGALACGLSGERGLLFWLAVDPSARGQGCGSLLLRAAEDWLRQARARFAEVRLRDLETGGFHERRGYRLAEPLRLTKPLVPVAAGGVRDELPVTVTWLEMTEIPRRASPAALPSVGQPVQLAHVARPSVAFYRYLYERIGENWFWWERRILDDSALLRLLRAPETEIYALNLGGEPAGLVEFNHRPAEDAVELRSFGLLPEYTGKGMGPFLLDWTVDLAWAHASAPRRLVISTCSLDHPAALSMYLKAGFRQVRTETRHIPDPRAHGLIPSHLPLPENRPALQPKTENSA